MSIVAIAAYLPVSGQEASFLILLNEHIRTLRELGLISDMAPLYLRSSNDTIIEIFEWISEEAKTGAHENPAVMKIWGQFSTLAAIVTLASLEEAGMPFAAFARLEV